MIYIIYIYIYIYTYISIIIYIYIYMYIYLFIHSFCATTHGCDVRHELVLASKGQHSLPTCLPTAPLRRGSVMRCGISARTLLSIYTYMYTHMLFYNNERMHAHRPGMKYSSISIPISLSLSLSLYLYIYVYI